MISMKFSQEDVMDSPFAQMDLMSGTVNAKTMSSHVIAYRRRNALFLTDVKTKH